MKASLHLGKGKSLHNDRDFDITKSDHIDAEKQAMNRYIVCSDNPADQKMSFSKWELKFYDAYFSASLQQTNENYIAQRHPERIKTMSDWVSETYKPTEAIIQLGNQSDNVDPNVLDMAFINTANEMRTKYPQVVPLDIAFHRDETTPHIHYRFVIIGHDKYGNIKPLKTQGLKEMGIERPDMLKSEGRYNNPLMTFTSEIREILYAQIEKLGVELDREPILECQHLDTLSYKKKQIIKDIDNNIKTLGQLEDDIAKKNEEIERTDAKIKAQMHIIKTSPHVLTGQEIQRIEKYYRSANIITGKVSIPEQEYISLIATKKVADNVTLLQEELANEKNKYVMAQRSIEADREETLQQAREEGIRQGLEQIPEIKLKAKSFDQFLELLRNDNELKQSLKRAMKASVKRYPQLTETLSKIYDWANDLRNKFTLRW